MTLRRPPLRLVALVAAALVLAWLIRFGCDDAFISYVYSRNLVYGDGLTWFGEHVEGYTNFGWVLWNSLGITIGIDPLVWSWTGSLAALAIVLVVAYRIVKLRTANETAALCAIALLATNFTFLAFGTSGLETMAQCALLTSAWLLVERIRRSDAPTVKQVALLSLLAALALCTRLDSTIYLAVLGVATALHLRRVRARSVVWLAAVAPALVLVGGWLAWKLVYYGDLLPNPFYAKVAMSARSIGNGADNVWWFVREYALYIPLAAALAISIANRRFTAKLPAALVAAWFAYVILVGGDFMEFRFFVVPMVPLFVAIAEQLVTSEQPTQVKPSLRAVAATVFCGAFSIKHAIIWDGSPNKNVDPIRQLANFYGIVQEGGWSSIGTPLGDVLQGTDAVLACNGAGAIPYYADIPTVDQLGLNDKYIARHGVHPADSYTRPGHQRFASVEYLAERKVNFVIGTPRLIRTGAVTVVGMSTGINGWISNLLGPVQFDENELVVVAAPVTRTHSLLLWYRLQTPEITARIRAAGWEMRTFYKGG